MSVDSIIFCLSPPSHWQKSFMSFSLGSSSWLLVANWKKYPHEFHWQRSFLALATAVRLERSKLNSIADAKKLFVSKTCLRLCAIDSQISFLASAIASKKSKTISETCKKWSQFGAVSETRGLAYFVHCGF